MFGEINLNVVSFNVTKENHTYTLQLTLSSLFLSLMYVEILLGNLPLNLLF